MKLVAVLAAAVLIGVAASFMLPAAVVPFHHAGHNAGHNSGQTARRGGGPKKVRPPVPVLAASAAAENVPIMIRGIGTVQAYNTVTVKSRVDGQIVKVAFRQGQDVKAGQLLFRIDPRPYQAALAQAEATKAKDAANLANAQRDLARDAALLKSGLAVTQQQYATQQALVAQLTATVQADQAQVDAAKLNVGYTSIASPIDGVAGLRLVDIGNYLSASAATPLVVVTQIEPIYVTFTVPERDIGRIRAAMAKHALAVSAFNGTDTQEIAKGRLKVVNNQVAQATGTLTLEAQFANRNKALWPGAFVNAHLVVDTVQRGVTVPAAAVLMGPKGPFVYLIGRNATVAPRPVAVTQVEAGRALIGKGLAVGDRVVVSGREGLSPGAKVAVKPGAPGEMLAGEPQIGPQGVGSTGVTTPPPGAGGTIAR